MREILDFAGFFITGIGGLGFFFVHVFIVKVEKVIYITELSDDGTPEGEDLGYTTNILPFWKRSIRRNKFADWSIKEGTTYCFLFIVVGFIIQLLEKLIYGI